MRIITVFLCLFLFSAAAIAVQPQEMLSDPVLEQRARDISRELRCPVCQGEDIDESNAALAADLRKLVRQRLTAGDSNEEVLQFLKNRYGDFILMNPPLQQSTLVLWLLPFAVLAAGGIAVFIFLKRSKA
jgi:cytochrome c-type biogenesis protein CcmH